MQHSHSNEYANTTIYLRTTGNPAVLRIQVITDCFSTLKRKSHEKDETSAQSPTPQCPIRMSRLPTVE
jgi:hypothetical protein